MHILVYFAKLHGLEKALAGDLVQRSPLSLLIGLVVIDNAIL
jgi:hypothetical protein